MSHVRRPFAALPILLLVALVAIAAQGAAMPHTHTGPGLYNAEHDLVFYAVLGGFAALADVPASPVGLVVLGLVLFALVVRPVGPATAAADPRAPPVR